MRHFLWIPVFFSLIWAEAVQAGEQEGKDAFVAWGIILTYL